MTTELGNFLRIVESSIGKLAVLYVSNDFEDEFGISASFRRPQWRLRFLLRPDRKDWLIWQVGGFASIEGIEGKVDLDIMKSTAILTRPAE